MLGIVGFLLLCILVNVDFDETSRGNSLDLVTIRLSGNAKTPDRRILYILEILKKLLTGTSGNIHQVSTAISSKPQLSINISWLANKSEIVVQTSGSQTSKTTTKLDNFESMPRINVVELQRSPFDIFNITRIFCTPGDNKFFEQQHHHISPNDNIQIWLTDDDKAWCIIIVIVVSLHFFLLGMVIVYFVLRRKPTWLYSKNPRIVRLSQFPNKIILHPKLSKTSR